MTPSDAAPPTPPKSPPTAARTEVQLPDSTSLPMLSPMNPLLIVEIEEGTPAAEALKANADVRVSKLHKVARSTRLQAGVRALKVAARAASGQPGHASDRRGAPAFVAPRPGTVSGSHGNLQGSGSPPTILEGEEEDQSMDRAMAKQTRMENGLEPGDDGASARGSSPSKEDDLWDVPMEDFLDDLEDILDENKIIQSNNVHSNGHHSPQFTHAALPAAVAAACRAAEDLERQRASTVITPLTASGQKSQIMLSNIFKSGTQNHVPTLIGDRKEEKHLIPSVQLVPSPNRSHHSRVKSSDTLGMSQPMSLSILERSIVEEQKNFPFEISLIETHKQSNSISFQLETEELSEDGKMDTTTPLTLPPIEKDTNMMTNEKLHSQKGDFNVEEIKLDEGETVLRDSENTHDTPLMKAKKKSMRLRMTVKSPIDDNFHFHGSTSVRNWVRRRRHDIEGENVRSYVKGKVIDGQHELYAMSFAVMLGMRTSIGRTNMLIAEKSYNERRWLDNHDLMAVEKYEFPPRGSEITPPHQLNHTFKFKDYSPLAFAYLRRMFGVNEYEFLLSVCGNANYIEFQSNAKSGQFFFYSKDGKYMIKTMTNAESKFLRRITPHYFRNCALNPNTLVAKFLGMYRVKLYHLRRNVKFVVMKSVFDTDKFLHQLFDVKGSTTGRDARPGDAVKKDNDVRRSLPDGAFVLEAAVRDKLRKQVERDCEWLREMKIMDYSMLIGVHYISHRAHKRNLSATGKAKSKSNANHVDGVLKIQTHSCRSEDGDEFSSSSFDASHLGLDHFLDEDDEESFIEGSQRQKNKTRLPYDFSAPTSEEAYTSMRSLNAAEIESKMKKEAYVEKVIEDMYWPFHRLYDIHGRRRLIPIKDSLIDPQNIDRNCDESVQLQQLHQMMQFTSRWRSSKKSSLGGCSRYELPTFERPLSERKDGGFMMDLTDIETPLKLSIPGSPHMAEYCDGKIFYMGIIDILQQFNIRKRVEARWRRIGGKGWEAASCVHPSIYADRFISFFDEYTSRCPQSNHHQN